MQDDALELGLRNLRVEFAEPLYSTDGGLLLVVRHLKEQLWLKRLVTRLARRFQAADAPAFGFADELKLRTALVALLAGLILGYETSNQIAHMIETDPVWAQAMGRRITQSDFSRLIDLLAKRGLGPLREALASSAFSGLKEIHIDGDSSLLRLHGEQEGGGYNAHYHGYGYHTGWMFEQSTGRIAALWLMEGQRNTSIGQCEALEAFLKRGANVVSYRGDAGMPGPRLMAKLEEKNVLYVMRMRSNAGLQRLSEEIAPPSSEAGDKKVAFGEMSYQAGSWPAPRRVVAKFQAPEEKKGKSKDKASKEKKAKDKTNGSAVPLFWETFYFVTNRPEAGPELVAYYHERGEAERHFGEFKAAFEPNFRHAQKRKNEAWAQLLGLAHNVMVDLRAKLPTQAGQLTQYKPKVLERKDGIDWVTYEPVQVAHQIRTTLNRFRLWGLKLPSRLIAHGHCVTARLHATFAKPDWLPAFQIAVPG